MSTSYYENFTELVDQLTRFEGRIEIEMCLRFDEQGRAVIWILVNGGTLTRAVPIEDARMMVRSFKRVDEGDAVDGFGCLGRHMNDLITFYDQTFRSTESGKAN